MLIHDNSPLRLLAANLSRKQVLIFDGIRYAAEMTEIAYHRLADQLQDIARQGDLELNSRVIAMAMLDAWSIIDSVHRFRDLIAVASGVRKRYWESRLRKRTEDVAVLRDAVQHQYERERLDALIAGTGQIWGYLSWAEVRDGSHTGKWFMMSPGAVYAGDEYLFIGPAVAPVPVPLGHIRLNAFGKRVYLGVCVQAVSDAVAELENQLSSESVRSVGEAAPERRGTDWVAEGLIEVSVSTPKRQRRT